MEQQFPARVSHTLPVAGRGGGEIGGPPAERKFFFIHVMKTAGATLRRQILANFDRARSTRSRASIPTSGTPTTSSTTSPPYPRGSRADSGLHRALPVRRGGAARHGADHDHDPARSGRADALLPAPLQAATTTPPGPVARGDLRGPVLPPSFIKNHQAKLFAFTADDDPSRTWTSLDVDARRLELAKANLETVDVVGIQDRFDEFLGRSSSGASAGGSCSVTGPARNPRQRRPGLVQAADRGRQRRRTSSSTSTPARSASVRRAPRVRVA